MRETTNKPSRERWKQRGAAINKHRRKWLARRAVKAKRTAREHHHLLAEEASP